MPITNREYYEIVNGTSSLPSGWHQMPTGYSIRVYEDNPQLSDEYIEVPHASIDNLNLNKFSDLSDIVKYNTDEYEDLYNGEDIIPKFDNLAMNFIIDNSGSMSWNDHSGHRYSHIDELVARVEGSYPSGLTYRAIAYHGSKINTDIFARVESGLENSLSSSSVYNGYFSSDIDFLQIRIVRRDDRYPESPIDGDIVYDGFATSIIDNLLDTDTQYYYKVYLYDSNGTFSNGRSISATPIDGVTPFGISNSTYEIYYSNNIPSDSNTLAVFSCVSNNDNRLYDFSNHGRALSYVGQTIPWRTDVFLYARFDTESYFVSEDEDYMSSDTMSFLFNIVPYSLSGEYFILSRHNNNNVDYAISLNNGKIKFYSDSTSIESSYVFSEGENSVVAILFDKTNKSIDIYVNGSVVDTLSVSSVMSSIDSMKLYVGGNNDKNFFGLISDVSIHGVIRDSNYINEFYERFTSTASLGQSGDALVSFDFVVPDSYNYETVYLVRYHNKHRDENTISPTWVGDGELVATLSIVSSGTYNVIDSSVINSEQYCYRLFTQGANGKYGYLSDSSFHVVDIVANIDNGQGLTAPVIPSVTVKSVISSQSSIMIEWGAGKDVLEDIEGISIYHSYSALPVVSTGDIYGALDKDSTLVFSGDGYDSVFVHRGLRQNHNSYYTLVFRTKHGYMSVPVTISAVSINNDMSYLIPKRDVDNLSFEVIDKESLLLSWDKVNKTPSTVDAYMGDRVYIYATIQDELGQPVIDMDNIDVNVEVIVSGGEVSSLSATVFDYNIPEIIDNDDVVSYSINRDTPGLLKIVLRSSDEIGILNNLSNIMATVSLRANLSTAEKSIFRYRSTSVDINFRNPLSFELVNRDGRSVEVECRLTPEELDNHTFIGAVGDARDMLSNTVTVDGAYIRSLIPFVSRANISYRGQPIIGEVSVETRVWDVENNVCSAEDKNKVNLIAPSTSVLAPNTTIPVVTEIYDKSNDEYITDEELISFADIPIRVPREPNIIGLFVKFEYAGQVAFKHIIIRFENILRVSLTTQVPISNGVDIAEQQASVYIIDPDSPTTSFRLDGIPAEWSLTKRDFGQDRPFYSENPVPGIAGVTSWVNHGVTRDVFFGPADNVELQIVEDPNGGVKIIGEKYLISVSVSYDGLLSSDSAPVELLPSLSEQSTDNRILMSKPSYKDFIYSDGEDFVKITISHNPSTSNAPYSLCFRECLEDHDSQLIILQRGQIVTVTGPGDAEIIHGLVNEVTDPYSNETYLDIDPEHGFVDRGSASVILDENSDYTYVYLRVNRYIPPVPPAASGDRSVQEILGAYLNPCRCLNILSDQEEDHEFSVYAEATVNIDGEVRNVIGGGDIRSGIPPVMVVPAEPLDMSFVGIKANGYMVSDIVVDGVTENLLVFKASFSGRNIPDGTPIKVEILSEEYEIPSALNIDKNVSIQNYIDETISSEVTSYAVCNIGSMSPEINFYEKMRFTISYDKRGDVAREITSCVTVQWYAGLNIDSGQSLSVFNNKSYIYDIANNMWESVADMPVAIGHSPAIYHNDYIHIIGGLSSNFISSTVYSYSVLNDEWSVEEVEPIPVPLFGHSATMYNGDIYIAGGIYLYKGVFRLSNDIYRYSFLDTTWEKLAEIPNPIARFYLNVVNVGGSDKITIIGGILNINSVNWSSTKYSDWYYEYDISANTWMSTEIPKMGDIIGASDGTSYVSGESIIIYKDQSYYKYDIQNGTLEHWDRYVKNIPPLLNGIGYAYSSSEEKLYMLGGKTHKADFSSDLLESDYGSLPVSTSVISKSPGAHNSSLMAIMDDIDKIFISGGFSPNKPSEYLHVSSSLTRGTSELDSKSSVTASIRLINSIGDMPNENINVIVKGYVSPSGSDDGVAKEELLKYPVLFSSSVIEVVNGVGSVVLLPRGDDFLEDVEKDGITMTDGRVRNPYDIIIELTIDHPYYYGGTRTVFDDTIEGENDVPEDAGAGGLDFKEGTCHIGNILGSSIETMASSNVSYISPSVFGEDNSMVPAPINDEISQRVALVSSDTWIPSVTTMLGDNLNIIDLTNFVNKVRSSLPFGSSEAIDAIYKIGNNTLGGSESSDIFYSFIDKEVYNSLVDTDDVIGLINSINGENESPVINTLYSIVGNSNVLPANAKMTYIDEINRISRETGGHVATVLSDNFDEEIVSSLVYNGVGSIGYGYYRCVYNFEQTIYLDYISPIGYSTSVSNISCVVEISHDGSNYIELGEFDINEVITIRKTCKYVRFLFIFKVLFNTDEYVSYVDMPYVDRVLMVYNNEYVANIFMNRYVDDSNIFNLTFSSSRDSSPNMTILGGVSTSHSEIWLDYDMPSKRAVKNNGRVIVPFRGTGRLGREPLSSKDGYVYTAKYGPWNSKSKVHVYNNDEEISSGEYVSMPSMGLIIFNYPIFSNEVSMSVENQSGFTVGAQLRNFDSNSSLRVYDFGYMWNDRTVMPTSSPGILPRISHALVSPDIVTTYGTITASYQYYDTLNREEDVNNREIKWYINGVHRPFLDNLISWNNISDPNDPLYYYAFSFNADDMSRGETIVDRAKKNGESLVKINDTIYFTIKVSNGDSDSVFYKSNTSVVLGTSDSISNVRLSFYKDGTVASTLRTDCSVRVSFDLLSDRGTKTAEVIWFVNGAIFKSEEISEGQISQISSAESSNGLVALDIGNSIYASVRSTLSDTYVSSNTVVVENSIPVITAASIVPAKPVIGQSIRLSYVYFDTDFANGNQNHSNKSRVQWFMKSVETSNEFVRVSQMDNQTILPSSYVGRRQYWKAVITPYDGFDFGSPVDTNTVFFQ